jgi:uncharacterized protein YpbB
MQLLETGFYVDWVEKALILFLLSNQMANLVHALAECSQLIPSGFLATGSAKGSAPMRIEL